MSDNGTGLTTARPNKTRSANLFALALEVYDHVRDRHRETLAGAVDNAALEPVRTSFGMCGDDDLVGPESPQRILHRLKRLSVADLAARVDAGFPQAGETAVEPLASRIPRLVLVRDPVLERRVQRRADDEHLLPVALAPVVDRLS